MRETIGKLVVVALLMFVAAGNSWGQGSGGSGKAEEKGSVVGDWKGTLSANGSQLHLVLHVNRAKDGNLGATLDSLDQGANGIPVSAIAVKDGKLSLTVAAVGGTYEGTVNADATEIKGTWTQRQPIELNFERSAAAKSGNVAPSDIDGAWTGTLDAGSAKLRVVFHIFNSADGLKATMDSLDQGAKGIPMTSVTRDGTSLKMELKTAGGVFEGKISADKVTMEGTWTQKGNSLPLVLTRTKDRGATELKRPQNPLRPLPYREEEVSYENKVQGDTLAGTLTIPPGIGPFTAVLLITGSGPQDRDETLLGHKPFLVLSDWLTRRGIEVLRVDDRGIGKSTGAFGTATTADFATDVEAGVAFLKTRQEVNAKKLGLIGHSEGGVIAPMVAARNSDVAFIVMMAGTGVTGDKILLEQKKLIEESGGMMKADAEKQASEEEAVLMLVEKEKDSPRLENDLRATLAGKVSEPELGMQVKALTSPWFEYFLTYDPAGALRKVKCPVLVLSGEKDLQVPPAQNLPAIRKALDEGGNTHFKIVLLPGLNHLFQTATTGSPMEYAGIEETMSPVAMETISGWILGLV
jgi:fermentation-respiration switch protein FrsA (DUF1100 family)